MSQQKKCVVEALKREGNYYNSNSRGSARYYKNNPLWEPSPTGGSGYLRASDEAVLRDAGLWYTITDDRKSRRYYTKDPDYVYGHKPVRDKEAETAAIKAAGKWYISGDKHHERYFENDPNYEPPDVVKLANQEECRRGSGMGGVNLSKKPRYVCDFETRNSERDIKEGKTSVWLWAAADVQTGKRVKWGKDILSFMEWLFDKKTAIIYFHNLAFDGSFIVNFLGEHFSATYVRTKDKLPKRANGVWWQTLIGDLGQWYSIRIRRFVNGKMVTDITIQDSLKILNFPVRVVAKAFNTQSEKGECDFKKYRPKDYEPTAEEIDYCSTDCEIVAEALYSLFAQGLTKMTAASCALSGCKHTIKDWDELFPKLSEEEEVLIRSAYYGGYTFVNPKYRNMVIEPAEEAVREAKAKGETAYAGTILDVNSMYPYVMKTKCLPYGKPVKFKGSPFDVPPVVRKQYPLFIVNFTADIRAKPDQPFMAQSPAIASGFFGTARYVKNYKQAQLCMSSVDFSLLMQCYDVKNIEWEGGWLFRGREGMFSDYIEKWAKVKQTSKGAKRSIAKLMLNSLYGKFGANPCRNNKEPIWSPIDRKLQFQTVQGEYDVRAQVYVPVAIFVTSWARDILHEAIMAVGYDNFLYCDTDSVHFKGTELPKGLKIHPTELGAWDIEGRFLKGKYLHAKAYAEQFEQNLDIKLAGCPIDLAKAQIKTIDEFKERSIVYGKLRPKQVEGGVQLVETSFEIKATETDDAYIDGDEKPKELGPEAERQMPVFESLAEFKRGFEDDD